MGLSAVAFIALTLSGVGVVIKVEFFQFLGAVEVGEVFRFYEIFADYDVEDASKFLTYEDADSSKVDVNPEDEFALWVNVVAEHLGFIFLELKLICLLDCVSEEVGEGGAFVGNLVVE
jgi:hypothetical protein